MAEKVEEVSEKLEQLDVTEKPTTQNKSDVDTLIELAGLEQQGHIRGTAIEVLLGLSANRIEGAQFFSANLKLVSVLVEVASKEKRYLPVANDAWLALVNLSAYNNEEISKKMLDDFILPHALTIILDTKSENADSVCMLLANLVRDEKNARALCDLKFEGKKAVPIICDIFCQGPAYNDKATFHYLGNVLLNISQVPDGRQDILARVGEGCVLQRLLPFTTYAESVMRRGGAIGCIRNCCFSSSDHKWLLSEEVNILPHLLLPLTGPEEIDDDDMDCLPDELQYMDPDKTREEDPDIRKLLLECLTQLTTTKAGRVLMREKKIYAILKHYHLWETDAPIRDACEEIVSILITPEMEDTPEMQNVEDGNLRNVVVPEDFDNPAPDPNAVKRTFNVGTEPGYYLKNQSDFSAGF